MAVLVCVAGNFADGVGYNVSMYSSLIIGAVIIVAVGVLIESGKRIVRSVGVLARRFGVSEFVISFALIAFATSLPEFSVGLNAAFSGVPEISFGDILGTNIVNITLIVGIIAVVGQSITLRDYAHFKANRLYQLTIVLAPLILLLDGSLSRGDGAILLILFVWNLFRFLDIDDMTERKVLRPHLAEHAHHTASSRREVWWHGGVLVASVVALIGATFAIVWAAQSIAVALAMPTVLIGVLIIATCTSLPELTVGLRSTLQGRGGVALGDIFGAAAFNSTLTLGVVALIAPITLTDVRVVWIGIGFTIAASLLVFYFLHTKQSISRREGMMLIACYVLFIGTQLWW